MREEILDMEQTKLRKRASVWKNGLICGFVITLFHTVLGLYPLFVGNKEVDFSTYLLVYELVRYSSFFIEFGGILFVMFRVSISYFNQPDALKKVIATGLIAYQTTIIINIKERTLSFNDRYLFIWGSQK